MARLIGIVVIAVVVYAMYRYMGSTRQQSELESQRPRVPTLGPGDYEEAAAIADGPDRGFGVLRVTPSQLIFSGNSGRLVAIERLDITGVTTTTELPDHNSARPVLVVTTTDNIHYFLVEDPAAWERRLL